MPTPEIASLAPSAPMPAPAGPLADYAGDDEAPPVPLPAPAGSRLAALVDDYYRIKPEFVKLTAQFEEIKDAIKAEARTRTPDTWSVDIYAPGHVQPVKVRGGWRRKFMRSVFDKYNPGVWESYCEWRERWEVKL